MSSNDRRSQVYSNIRTRKLRPGYYRVTNEPAGASFVVALVNPDSPPLDRIWVAKGHGDEFRDVTLSGRTKDEVMEKVAAIHKQRRN